MARNVKLPTVAVNSMRLIRMNNIPRHWNFIAWPWHCLATNHPDTISVSDRLLLSNYSDFYSKSYPLDFVHCPTRSTRYHSISTLSAKITHPWRKLNTLGKGAFGVVYLGVDNTGMRFAAKEVHMNGKLEKTLKDEIKILARLSHENIVRCFGHDSAGDKVYMFMELMQGSVKDKMDEDNEPISTKTAQKYTRQMMKGLIYLHQNGVVHRDIKCANVLRSDKDTVKLADMGVSKVHTHITQSIQAERAGSYHWMSPEVMGAQEGGRRSDVWSVGCTVYEMIKQKPPFAEIQGLIVLYELHQKTSQMEHRALVISDKEMDHTLKEFLLTIFVKKDQRPLADHLAEHLWLR